ncbi:MAG: M24 family metallopeptidase [Spirochaetota bacterium]
MSKEVYSHLDLEKFKSVQRLAYEAVVEVRKQLVEGMTEKEAASLINEYVKKNGAGGFFHYGFAWFGDRTSFTGFQRPTLLPSDLLEKMMPPHLGIEFMPSNRKLEKGMPVILDVAPIIDGYSADIGYSFAFGDNPEVDKAIMDLEIFRIEILEMVLAEKTLGEIYRRTDAILEEMGYRNCHTIYPSGLLGHKVGKIPFTWLPPFKVLGFQIQTFVYLFTQMAEQTLNGSLTKSPLWNEEMETTPEVGLWAIEPHIGKGDIGVKWEEILVVTDATAYWLDDDLPHVNFWKEHKKELAHA